MGNKYNRRSALSKAASAMAAILLFAACGFLAYTAVRLHIEEVEAQVAAIGYYKQDVYLDFGRQAATVAASIGAVVSGMAGVFLTIYRVIN